MANLTNLLELGSSLYSMQQEGTFCDVTIECNGGRISAHGCLLGVVSESLRESIMVLGCRTIRLDQVSLATMEVIIRFVYTASSDVNARNIIDVLKAAHRLQIDALVTYCVDTFTVHVNESNVLEAYELETPLIAELRDIAFTYLEKNVMRLLVTDAFLDDAAPGVMRLLLESDNLVVPDEDAVFELLASWLQRDAGARMTYASSFKELIRLPFLRVETVSRLEELAGPLRGMPRLEDVDTWDLQLPLFQKRKYGRVHCHFVWQERVMDESLQLFVTCGDLRNAHNILVKTTLTSMDEVDEAVVCGHGMCLRKKPAGLTMMTFDPCTEASLGTIAQDAVIQGVHLNADGEMQVLVRDVNQSKIYVRGANGTFNELASTEQHSNVLQSYRGQPILAKQEPFTINLTTGAAEALLEPEEYEFHGDLYEMKCISSLRRGDLLFLYYRNIEGYMPQQFLMVVDLAAQEWIHKIQDDLPRSFVDVHLMEIRGEVYISARNTAEDSTGETVLRKLDEEIMKFVFVQNFDLPTSSCVGIAPLGATPCCPSETWLSAQYRKLPDDTPRARRMLEKLRQIM